MTWSTAPLLPGASLDVRILGEGKKEYADILRVADDNFMTARWAHLPPATVEWE
ncbi:MAG: hypothetical protein ACXIU5_08050 [Halomonadaceae bacterium]